jgi:hypothetical protein
MITTNSRASRADVFATELRATGPDTFEATVRLPAADRFHGPVGRTHDPLLLLESVRMAGLLVAHDEYEVPADFQFVVHEMMFNVDPAGLRTRRSKPVDIVVNISADEIRRRRQNFAGMRFEFVCMRDGEQFGRVSYRWSCLSPDAYRGVRGAYKNAVPAVSGASVPVRPKLVGRHDTIDVMLAKSPDGSGWRLRVDPQHPELFDHPTDHVPGNGLIEAVRQAALLAAGQPNALPVAGDIDFHHYVEFDRPSVVLAEKQSENTINVRVRQDDRIAMVADIELRTLR